ncbi:MAG: hypothetical protein K8F35_04680 [Dokdonella sp.]|uniref:hypothetical protein n=1 Tax=Dokdonella sp. TaxID=2291710 RepID=UPI0025BCE133|nr:hypothetical protein [Dokdonella sp.]MBZ0222302.1 hypothetical protein [Dokdonella sp.]
MSEPNYEALGRYHHMRQQREELLAGLRIGNLFKELHLSLMAYNPKDPELDHVPAMMDQAIGVLPGMRARVGEAERLRVAMEELRVRHGLKVG